MMQSIVKNCVSIWESQEESKTKIEAKKDIEKKEELNQKFSRREQEFLKRDLKSKADFLVER